MTEGLMNREPLTPLEVGLEQAVRRNPSKIAMHYRIWVQKGREAIVKEWKSCTYQEFWDRIDLLSKNLLNSGLIRGDRALVLWIPPTQFDVLAMMFALLRIGVVIVWIDPRTMTVPKLISNIELVAPRVVFADSAVRKIVRGLQMTGRVRCIKIIVGSKVLMGTSSIEEQGEEKGRKGRKRVKSPPPPEHLDMDGGAIMFTTGSTGTPKAVRLTGENLAGQADAYYELIKKYKLGDVTAVHAGMNFCALDLAMGNTTIPLPNPSNPGNIKPEWIEDICYKFAPSILTGSRVIFENLVQAQKASDGSYKEDYLSSLKMGFSGGAPVTPPLFESVCRAIPSLLDFFSAYGCTEGLPLTMSGWRTNWGGSMDSEIVEKSRKEGYGIVVGDNCPHTETFLLDLEKAEQSDVVSAQTQDIPKWDESFECKPGQIGELVIRSPSVSPGYIKNDLANALSKFAHPSGNPPMHRTGDLAFMDKSNRLWMVGRIAQIVKVDEGKFVPPICIESLFERFDNVQRCAFVGGGSKRNIPLVIILRWPEFRSKPFDVSSFIEAIRASSKWAFVIDHGVQVVEYDDGDEFPMDFRHNSKVRRELLEKWANKKLKL